MKLVDIRILAVGPILGACLLALVYPTTGWAQAKSTATQSSRPIILMGALVRDARIAQRDCDVEAKRNAVNTIQRVMRTVSVDLRRMAGAIRRDTEKLRRDGVDFDDLKRVRTAPDAMKALDEIIGSTDGSSTKKKLGTLRNLYVEFDGWEKFYIRSTRILARLDGAPGKCGGAPIVRQGADCPPEAFEACRYGGPSMGHPRNIFVAIPIKKK